MKSDQLILGVELQLYIALYRSAHATNTCIISSEALLLRLCWISESTRKVTGDVQRHRVTGRVSLSHYSTILMHSSIF